MTNGSPPGVPKWSAANTIAVLALVESVIAAAFAVFQTQRANDISDGSYHLSQAIASKLGVYVDAVDGVLTQSNGEPAIHIQVELVNPGEVHLSGCRTIYEDSDGGSVCGLSARC